MTGIPDEQILVAVFPGLPTSAELFILPHKNTTERRKSSETDLEQVRKEGFMEHSFPVMPFIDGLLNLLQFWK